MGRIQGDLIERTFAFAVRILKCSEALPNDARGWSVGRQLIRSGTSIGANIREADHALTDRDFTHKISVARKEAAETLYWIDLIAASELIPEASLGDLRREADQLVSILATIVKRMHHAERTKRE